MRFFAITISLFLILQSANADELNKLTQVQVSGKDQIHMVFSENVSPQAVEREFRDGLIQISVQNSSVFPAKILSVNGGSVSKVFAYQYTPKLVRARFSVEGKSDELKKRLRVNYSGKMITVTLVDSAPAKDTIATHAAQALRLVPEEKAEKAVEKAAVDRSAEKPLEKTPEKAVTTEDQLLKRIQASESQPLHLASSSKKKAAPSPIRAILALTFVLALVAGGAYFLKRSKTGNQLLNQIRKKNQMIEVLANQALGPKRSVSVVKVAGRILVLGVTPESVNLITEVSSEGEIDLEQVGRQVSATPVRSAPAGASFFANLLEKETAQSVSTVAAATPQSSVVRDRIRSRIEGMKRL